MCSGLGMRKNSQCTKSCYADTLFGLMIMIENIGGAQSQNCKQQSESPGETATHDLPFKGAWNEYEGKSRRESRFLFCQDAACKKVKRPRSAGVDHRGENSGKRQEINMK